MATLQVLRYLGNSQDGKRLGMSEGPTSSCTWPSSHNNVGIIQVRSFKNQGLHRCWEHVDSFRKDGRRKVTTIRLIKSWRSWIWDQHLSTSIKWGFGNMEPICFENKDFEFLKLRNFEIKKPRNQEAKTPINQQPRSQETEKPKMQTPTNNKQETKKPICLFPSKGIPHPLKISSRLSNTINHRIQAIN